MLRGIDKRDIFIENEDRMKFIDNISKAQEVGKFETYGYCLMDNHIHMLLKEAEEVGTSIKRITVGYVGWHNRKYERTGHLFQNRYLSEKVETESYLLTVLRYIHQNPVKAGIVRDISDYEWSSYNNYYQLYKGQSNLINGDLIRAYFETFEAFSDFMSADNADQCLELKMNERHNDKALRELIDKKYDVSQLAFLPAKERNALIKEIYYHTNASIRQLSRVLGLGRAIVEKAVKHDK